MKLSTTLFVSSGLAVLFAAMPFFSALAASAIASVSGCALDEGSRHSCLIFGIDAGPTLYVMGVSFWLFIFTWLYLPVAVGFVVAGFIVRARGRKDSALNQKISVIYWLLFFAAMTLPFARNVALVLALIAAFLWWQRKRNTTNAEV